MAITYKIEFQVKQEKLKLFQRLLHHVLDRMSSEANYRNAYLQRHPEDRNRFMLFETWEDHDDVVAVQLQRDYRREWHKALPDLLESERKIEVWNPVRGDTKVHGRGAVPSKTSPSIIRVADADLFYRDWGSGAPVVFLAGWAMPSNMWAYQMLYLSKQGFRTVAYDRRGHGRSSDPGGSYDYDTLAEDLSEVLTALNLWDVTLVSYSMGAGEVVRYLSRHGSDRISRVVMIAPTTLPFVAKAGDNPDGVDAEVLSEFQKSVSEDYPDWIARNAESFVSKEASAAMLEWLKGLCLVPSLQALLQCQYTNTQTDLRMELRSIDVPTLVIQGDEDASGSLHLTAERVVASIAQSQLLVYEGARHGLFVTHMDRLNRDLQAFAHQTSNYI